MKSNKINFKKLKVGQRVWSIQFGYCKIYELSSCGYYPIFVRVEKGARTVSFSKNGKLDILDKYPSLFLREPECFK